ncbi:NADH-quinone oxidoreductase subunit NuoH [Ereboglobus luteus]|uniref:NADH-quinone oxidoreductase subunit H n=1 Tax=Ereboglobus luteus TaxID=1796921 RepID=A0A2U8E1K9_9BACT|nr:NADH-quinone oxidoreductase subunit NuoH [Ereboglobus luteus]AWI08574.1 NADH-quinone oxidoreductase subunit H [Ereboglobus luteus]
MNPFTATIWFESFARRAESLPVRIHDWILGLLPAWPWLHWLVTALLAIVVILTFYGLFFAMITVTERKGLGRFQNRPGPNRTGPCGLLQPFADAIKAICKEDIVPATADKVLHFIAPCATVFFGLLTLAIIPAGPYFTALNLDAGVLYFFAAGAASELAIFMAGWSSHNKYSLISSMRALAQLISFELPLLLISVSVVMAAGTLSLPGIVAGQSSWTLGGIIPQWNILTPWGIFAFIILFIAALAETNRCPFDLPEGESEIIAGHLTEYSGFKYALFFMGEYFGMLALSGLAITLFFGGWNAPCEFLQFIPSYIWFPVKLFMMMCLFIWIRATLLRLRIDQLMRFAWKLLVPLSLVNLVVVAFWMRTGDWAGPLQLVRWAGAFALEFVPFLLIGRHMSKGLGPRKYKYAQ